MTVEPQEYRGEIKYKTFWISLLYDPEMAKIGLDKLPEAKIRKPRDWKLSDWPDLRNMEIFK